MHTARQLEEGLFAIRVAGEPASRADLLPDWHKHDRLGIVMTEPFGAIGASYLIELAITAHYDLRPQTRGVNMPAGEDDLRALYPEIYLFHVGGRYGDHSVFDFWPARKEVFLSDNPREVLGAINDRAITRLAVPDGVPVPVVHEFKEPQSAHERIVSVFAYGPDGRAKNADVEIVGLSGRVEANVRRILVPEERYAGGARSRQLNVDEADPDLLARTWPVRTEQRRDEAAEGLELANARREAIKTDGLATETYRRITVQDALGMLALANVPAESSLSLG